MSAEDAFSLNFKPELTECQISFVFFQKSITDKDEILEKSKKFWSGKSRHILSVQFGKTICYAAEIGGGGRSDGQNAGCWVGQKARTSDITFVRPLLTTEEECNQIVVGGKFVSKSFLILIFGVMRRQIWPILSNSAKKQKNNCLGWGWFLLFHGMKWNLNIYKGPLKTQNSDSPVARFSQKSFCLYNIQMAEGPPIGSKPSRNHSQPY